MILLRGRKECHGQVAIIDRRQEEIRQEDDKAKEGQQGRLPVDESAFRVVPHPRLFSKRLKTHSDEMTLTLIV
jgi:hypothetical protein